MYGVPRFRTMYGVPRFRTRGLLVRIDRSGHSAVLVPRLVGVLLAGMISCGLRMPPEAQAQDTDELQLRECRLHARCTVETDPSESIGRIVFSANSTSVYADVECPGVNIWALLVYRWPEILETFLLLTTVGAVCALWRVARRKEFVGKPYCRECGYCLEGCPSDACPECGAWRGARRARAGRPTWRRALPAMVVFAFSVGSCAVLSSVSLPRAGRVVNWLNWWSTELLDWGTRYSLGEITKKSSWFSRVVEIDVATGRRLRAVTASGVGFGAWPRLLPNGRDLLVTRDSGIAVLRVDSGRIVQLLRCPDEGVTCENLMGSSDDGQIVYSAALDGVSKTAYVAYSVCDGKGSVLFETEAAKGLGGVVSPRRAFPVVGSGGRLAVEWPGEYCEGVDRPDMLVRDLEHRGEVILAIPTPRGCSSPPFFTSDGRTVFRAAVGGPHCLYAWDLQTGQQIACLDAPASADPCQGLLGFDSQRSRLFLVLYRNDASGQRQSSTILVADALKWRWLARLVFPEDAGPCFAQTLDISPDGRTLAVVCASVKWRSSATHLLLWDLSVLDNGVSDW